MILVDTSAWIEYLRGTRSVEHLGLRRLIETGAPLATTDPVVMDLLAGARDEEHLKTLRRFVLRFANLPVEGLSDYEAAADVYRRCRRAGITPRSLTDCLIARVAIRENVPLLARNRDFEAIGRVCGMRLHSAG